MDLSAILRELRDGQSAAARTGLFWLLVGAGLTIFMMFLMSPAVGGLRGLPGHVLDRPDEPAPVARAPVQPQLTARQKTVARKTSVKVALQQVGAREVRVNNSSRIIQYRRAVTGKGEDPRRAEPWCADFVSWAWRRAGVPIGFDGRGSDYVPELVAWAKLSGRWRGVRQGYRPRAGDLIVYKVGGSWRGHVGLVVAYRSGTLHTVEGNWGDRVARRTVKPWAANVTGFIAPV